MSPACWRRGGRPPVVSRAHARDHAPRAGGGAPPPPRLIAAARARGRARARRAGADTRANAHR
eukprot:scaffold118443_cov67-Phaeocystis_antarctica.AAC.4